jgi:hypothetical protein
MIYKFIKYTTELLNEKELNSLYLKHNIDYNRTVLYSDFIESLFELIFTTYIGDEYYEIEDKFLHFDWCWYKNLENFKEENIIFITTDICFEYFLSLIYETFYDNKLKSEETNNKLISLYKNILSYTNKKTNSEFDEMIKLYQMIEKMLQFKINYELSVYY